MANRFEPIKLIKNKAFVTKYNKLSIPTRISPSLKELINQKKPIYKIAFGFNNMPDSTVTEILVREHKAMEKKLRDIHEEIECRIDFF